MSRGGRVMGRGRSSQPPPEVVESAKEEPLKQLKWLLQSLRADAGLNEKLTLRDVTIRVAEDPNNYLELANALYNACQTDWRKVDIIGDICCQLASLEPHGIQFRNNLLTILSIDHKNIAKLSEQQQLSLTAMLCHLLVNMRNNDGKHFDPLAGPVATSLASILSEKSSDEAVECAAEQIKKARELLILHTDSTSLSKLKSSIRQALINDRGHPPARLQLLDDFEVFSKPATSR